MATLENKDKNRGVFCVNENKNGYQIELVKVEGYNVEFS